MRITVGDSGKIEPVFGELSGVLLVPTSDGRGFARVAAGICVVVDGRRSALWVERDREWAFAEFFETHFLENLANGAPRERFVVESYGELFGREFPRDNLELPKYYGDGLVRCPRCGRISRPLSYLGVIRCNDRDCRMDMNNPFYDRERIRESIEWGRLSYLAEYRDQYYCLKMERYYPAPPGRLAIYREKLSEWFRDWRRRRRGR